MGDYDLIFVLFSPQLWWLWESFFFFMYFVLKFARHWGKDRHVILRWSGSSWQQIGEYWIGATQKWFRSKSKKSFVTEPDSAAFSTSDLSGNHLTIFHDYNKGRPRDVEIGEKTPASSMKVKIKPGKNGLDPDSSALDTFLAEQAWLQGLKANRIGHPDLMLLVIIAGAALVIGLLVGPYVIPQHVVTVTSPVSNVTSTVTRVVP